MHLSTSTPPPLLGINTSPSLGRFPNPQNIYHTTLAVSLSVHQYNTRQFSSSLSSIPTTYWFLRPRVLNWHHTYTSNLKDVFSLCVLRFDWGASSFLWRSFIHHKERWWKVLTFLIPSIWFIICCIIYIEIYKAICHQNTILNIMHIHVQVNKDITLNRKQTRGVQKETIRFVPYQNLTIEN